MNVKFLSSLFILTLLFLAACEDQGDPVTTNVPTPTLTTVSPDSGKANDTVTVVGTNFGSTRGSSLLAFGSTNAGTYVSWSATQIKAVIPSGVSAGNVNVAVTVGGKSSNTKVFKSLTAVTLVKFSTDIMPLITTYACASCHPGNGGFSVASYAAVTGTGSHGAILVPGNAANSNIVKKLQGTASFGVRMPQGGPYLTNSEVQKFIDWINQGALNN